MFRYLMLAGLIISLAAFVGCGGGTDAPAEDDPTAGQPVEEAEPEVVPEAPAAEEEMPAEPEPEPEPTEADYAAMAPQEYGIEDVFFAFDEYALTAESMRTLEAAAEVMRRWPGITYVIEGHCDERGTVEYNLALGEKRAAAVRDYLVSLGVARYRLRITSYGEERPFAMGHDESAWALNRRAHFARP